MTKNIIEVIRDTPFENDDEWCHTSNLSKKILGSLESCHRAVMSSSPVSLKPTSPPDFGGSASLKISVLVSPYLWPLPTSQPLVPPATAASIIYNLQ